MHFCWGKKDFTKKFNNFFTVNELIKLVFILPNYNRLHS